MVVFQVFPSRKNTKNELDFSKFSKYTNKHPGLDDVSLTEIRLHKAISNETDVYKT